MMRELEVNAIALDGLHLVEASAGTGKTHNIALLYLRLLLEAGHAVDAIAVVTFTDAATRELRGRLRARIVEALARLDDPAPELADDLDALLAVHRSDPLVLERARHRLETALIGFDQAVVSTLHGLCARLLAELAFETGQPFAELEAESSAGAVLELVRDYWRRNVVANPSAGVEAVLERWAEPDVLAVFLTQSQALVLSAERIDPLDSGTLLAEAESQHAQAIEIWMNLRASGSIVRALAILRAAVAEKWLSSAKNGSHHPSAIDACEQAVVSAESIAPAQGQLRRPLLLSRILDARLKKAEKIGWMPESDLAEVARCAQALDDAERASGLARIALFLRGALDFVRTGLAERRMRLRRLGFDDLIRNLHEQLHDAHGVNVARRIVERLPAILVDEFQDTDALQYGILRRIHEAGSALFLIGDPKQAIYRFRGGDIFTYRSASDDAGEDQYTLLDNWRSDAPLIEAANAVFGGAEDAFLYRFIEFRPARFPEQRADAPAALSSAAPLTIWRMPDRIDDNGKVKPWTIPLATARVLAQVCSEVKLILRAAAARGEAAPSIAILVNSNRQAEEAARELAQWNVPCDYLSMASVYVSIDAAEIETLIAAVCAPGNAAVARAALATELLGETLSSLLAAEDDLDAWERLLARVAWLRQRWHDAGPYAVIAHCVQAAAARLLPHWDGRRRVTNLLHLAELLQHESARRSSPDELLRWFAERRREAEEKRGEGFAENVRPADDGGSVQVLTIHRSKGLQYDIVFAPFLYATYWHKLDESTAADHAVSWHDGDELRIDIGGPDWLAHARMHREEQFAESLRLAYVAITRARHRVWLAWAFANTGSGDSRIGPLAWLCLRSADMVEPGELHGLDPAKADAALAALAQRARGSIQIVTMAPQAPPIDALPLATEHAVSLVLTAFRGRIDRRFETWSYSRLFGGNVHAPIADHDETIAPIVAVEATAIGEPVAQRPRGAEFGNCMHDIFENVGFARLGATGSAPELARICDDHGIARNDHATVASMAREAVNSELVAGTGLRLAALAEGESLAELEFLFPLGGARLEAFEAILARDSRYARAPGELLARRGVIAGLMTGFIDLVLRWKDFYYVVDYKTNLLGATRDDYAPGRLASAVRTRDYDLQYLIYTVALQRFLRVRLGAGYAYDRHIGGALYLFVRGMRAGTPGGIHFDRPDGVLVDALDAWCEGGSA